MNPVANHPSHANRLVDRLSQVIVVAYRESTDALEAAFAREGLPCQVLRQEDKPEYQGFSAAYRCLLNHSHAWELAAQANKPTLIVEADCVPVVGIGQLPLPFNPHQSNVGIAWLYTCASQMYSVTAEGYIEGYSTALVAYILTPPGADCLRGLLAEVTNRHGTGYVSFDSDIDQYLRTNRFKNYIAFRNYAEHGGKANPEHRQNGLSGIHHADVLYGALAFMPPYAADAKIPYLTLLGARSRARLKGLVRLAIGKFLRPQVARTSSFPLRLVRTAIWRQLSWRL